MQSYKGDTCWKQLNVSQVLFPASSSHYFASTADNSRGRELLFTRREMRACKKCRPACLVASEADYLHRVLWVDRSLTANTPERFARIAGANNIVRDTRKFRVISWIFVTSSAKRSFAESCVDVIIFVETRIIVICHRSRRIAKNVPVGLSVTFSFPSLKILP